MKTKQSKVLFVLFCFLKKVFLETSKPNKKVLLVLFSEQLNAF